MENEKKEIRMIKLDATTIVSYPTSSKWADYYERFHRSLVNSLNGRYCVADREDAVEEAFHKLMHKKDMAAYGEKMPQTEADWYWNLHWQARSFLSRIKERAERHSRYVEAMSKALAGIFACGHQGEEMDAGISTRALVRALETFRKEQDVSRRDLVIYVGIETGAVSGMELAKRYQLTAENVYVIKHRMGHLLRKHGPRCFERAIRREGYISFTSAA